MELFLRSRWSKDRSGPAVEGAVGFNWYPFDTRQVWINAEVAYIWKSPYGGGYYMYSVGQTGVVIPVQFLLRF